MRRPSLIAAFALAVAASGATTPASASGHSPGLAAGPPATASRGPAGHREVPGGRSPGLAAQAPVTESRGPAGHRGVPGGRSPGLAPQHHGTLRVTGSLRDGGIVRATGLSWRPGALPPGDRLLSFEVGYYWDACTTAGKCQPGADTTATPFAASRYVVGHADTSRLLRLTETASEVVETSPATFSFSIKSASVSATASGAVRAYRAGRPPVSEFVNGTPERRTASAEEYFSVAAPHFSARGPPGTAG